jgi:hypothetical protein
MRALKTMAVTGSLAALCLTATPASAAPPPWSYIHNSAGSAVDIGVIYEWDDGGALYDAILPVDRRTDRHLGWVQAEGYYIGPGYCATSMFTKNNVDYLYQVRAHGQLQTPRNAQTTDTDGVARWWVDVYRC